MNKSSAYWDGWDAMNNGVPSDHNPYNEKSQHNSFEEWSNGWWASFYKERRDKERDDEEE